jgi:L-alanine-DL-glutamate epimerase-like enolase superfamily enzyme
MRSTDIRIRDVQFEYEDYLYRSPIKFGGVALDRVTILNVRIQVENRAGTVAEGRGSMPLGNVWAFPSRRMGYADTLEAMKEICDKAQKIYSELNEFGHPIDLGIIAEHQLMYASEHLPPEEMWIESIPALATLVVNSPYDAALHDAYGQLLQLNCYKTYSSQFVNHDLGHYLGSDFQGEYLDQYLLAEPKPTMPLYHLVGALDPLTPGDVKEPVNDGLPEHLAQWIHRDGLTHLKIKLNGDDVNWDLERILTINRVTEAAQAERKVTEWFYSLDFNERCQNVAYLIELLGLLKSQSSAAFERVQYIEQPTARDLKANRQNVMHEASKIRPVVIDESLIDLESLYLAREMGYTGVAFKACKGQTQTLLLAAAAQKLGLFRCVQDLTCPGASLIHSAGIAAHIPGVAAIESNGRQYCPAANLPWAEKYPGIFEIRDGVLHTALLSEPGLSARRLG